MHSMLHRLFEKAKALSDGEPQKLIGMLEEYHRCGLLRAEIEREWNEEVVRRYLEYKGGKVAAIPAEKVFRRLEGRFGR